MDPREMKAKTDNDADLFITNAFGHKIDLMRPDPESISIEWIARTLARMPRWNGDTLGQVPYSVAQHSVDVAGRVYVATRGARDVTLAALLHDAHEAFIGDIKTPVKEALVALGLNKEAFDLWTDRLDGAIHEAAGLPRQTFGTWKTIIKSADMAAGLAEYHTLFPEDARLYADWGDWDGSKADGPLSAASAEYLFLDTYIRLINLPRETS